MKNISDSLEEAVLKTLAYSSVFNYPLNSHEVYKFLIGKKASHEKVAEILQKSQLIVKNEQYYYLKNKSITYTNRKSSKIISDNKMKIARRIGRLMSFIPTIKMVGITGSLSMDNSKTEDDIDYLLVISTGCLWITRLFLTIVLDTFGLRRRPEDKSYKNKICLNMYLDNSHLSLFSKNQNLYSAHEVVQMKPIINKEKTYQKFLFSNSWVLSYLPNAFSQVYDNAKTSMNEKVFLANILSPLENLMYSLQKRKMKARITNEIVDKHSIFFHPRDTKTQILSSYHKTLDMLN